MKILVTGHKGYIGSRLYKQLLNSSHEVAGIDLKEGTDILHCLPAQTFDCVFHLAAIPRVEYSVEQPFYTMKQNVLATSKLLEWSKNHNVKTFIFSSSAAVYGEGDGPKSPYGLHKLISEMECELYQKLYDMKCVCLRYFNVYSEEQTYGGPYSTVVAAWMEMIREGLQLRIDGDGNQSRDFIHVDDVVSANIWCMENVKKIDNLWYDVGYGQTCSLNQIKEIVDTYHDVEWVYDTKRPGDIKHIELSPQRLQLTGWTPHINIEDGMRKCFNKKQNNA